MAAEPGGAHIRFGKWDHLDQVMMLASDIAGFAADRWSLIHLSRIIWPFGSLVQDRTAHAWLGIQVVWSC